MDGMDDTTNLLLSTLAQQEQLDVQQRLTELSFLKLSQGIDMGNLDDLASLNPEDSISVVGLRRKQKQKQKQSGIRIEKTDRSTRIYHEKGGFARSTTIIHSKNMNTNNNNNNNNNNSSPLSYKLVENSNTTSSGGKPRDFVWIFYFDLGVTGVGNFRKGKCRCCGKVVTRATPPNLRTHLKKCPKATQVTKSISQLTASPNTSFEASDLFVKCSLKILGMDKIMPERNSWYDFRVHDPRLNRNVAVKEIGEAGNVQVVNKVNTHYEPIMQMGNVMEVDGDNDDEEEEEEPINIQVHINDNMDYGDSQVAAVASDEEHHHHHQQVIPEPVIEQQPPPPKRKRGRPRKYPRPEDDIQISQQTRSMDVHLTTSNEHSASTSIPMTMDAQLQRNISMNLLKSFTTSNVSLDYVESPFFREALRLANPLYRVPSKEELLGMFQ